MNGRSGLVVSIVVAGALVVWIATLSGTSSHARPSRPAAEPEPAAEPAQEALNSAVGRPGPAAPRLPAPGPPPPPPAAPPAVVQAPQPVAALARNNEPPLEAHRFSSAQLLARAFDTQTRDSLWATDAETKIRAAFDASPVSPDTLRKVECRQSVCKIDLHYDLTEQVALAAAYNALRSQFGPDFAFDRPQGPPAEDGKLEISTYVSRQGFRLRDFAQPDQP